MSTLSGENSNKFLTEAERYLQEAIIICKETRNWGALSDAFYDLSNVHELKGNTRSALASYKDHVRYRDSILDDEKNRQMARHELEYEYSRKKDSLDYVNQLQRKQLQTLEQQKRVAELTIKQQWLYGIIALGALCLSASFFVFRYRVKQLRLQNELDREKSEVQLKETEHQRRLNDITFSQSVRK
jgi:hypothetical protein